jgi:hypothetical protein
MLPKEEVAKIRAEMIERLEKALPMCEDSGIRERIQAWIEREKKKLRTKEGTH